MFGTRRRQRGAGRTCRRARRVGPGPRGSEYRTDRGAKVPMEPP